MPAEEFSITLLFFNGSKIQLKINQELVSGICTNKLIQDFTINDLVNFLFNSWDDLFAGNNDETSKPTFMSQIQLLHLGIRLQPKTKISSLNLTVSSVFHMIIKPEDMVKDRSGSVGSNNSSKKTMIKKLIQNNTIGNHNNGLNTQITYSSLDNNNSSNVGAGGNTPDHKKTLEKSKNPNTRSEETRELRTPIATASTAGSSFKPTSPQSTEQSAFSAQEQEQYQQQREEINKDSLASTTNEGEPLQDRLAIPTPGNSVSTTNVSANNSRRESGNRDNSPRTYNQQAMAVSLANNNCATSQTDSIENSRNGSVCCVIT
ncbi:hypothetical protein PACTADRAFT_49456 [Pachysolen tannophilus NRRL Y-2460]|uniref:UBL3-like ubiquitin domain-containing protein n=1 Tax=Pachysolen tannophilus NRRL Y-2460 TaxID=669874 RepID=A0A1E4TWD0_PACTA|nr:hypothetical protein PACTADRAFT_49456 [Pachysolen tannophilus NRRL Y-2460]